MPVHARRWEDRARGGCESVARAMCTRLGIVGVSGVSGTSTSA